MKRPRLGRRRPDTALPILPRLFAVLAAVLLVGSVGLAALLPSDISLAQALAALDETAPGHLQGIVSRVLGHGLWEAVFHPLLVRPVWLIPVSLGLICIGGALTSLSHPPPRTKQRRS